MQILFLRILVSVFALLCTIERSVGQTEAVEYKLHGGSEKQWIQFNINNKHPNIKLGADCDSSQVLIFSKKSHFLQRKLCLNRTFEPGHNLPWYIERQRNGRDILVINRNEKYRIRFFIKDLASDDGTAKKLEVLWLTVEKAPLKNKHRTHLYFISG
jgi:hypothetical protein